MQLENFAVACALNRVRSSSAHEHPTCLGAALSGTVQYAGDQCALQLAHRSGSARDRHRGNYRCITIAPRILSPRPTRWCSWWTRASPDGVMHGTVGLATLGASKAAAGLEVDLDVEPPVLGVEVSRRHHPRRHQAEGELEQIDITHRLSPLARVRRHPAAVLAAVKDRPSRARDPARP